MDGDGYQRHRRCNHILPVYFQLESSYMLDIIDDDNEEEKATRSDVVNGQWS